jgi:hypothetical protein
MTTQAAAADAPRTSRSAGAIVLGLLAVVVLSLGTDQLFHVLRVYPPWGQPMHDPWLNLLALGYRSVYTVLGGYLVARLAPRHPMRHVRVFAIIGLLLGIAGLFAALSAGLGPLWYPIALALTGPLLALLGGRLR